MARWLVQIDPTRAEQVKSSLSGIGIRPIAQIFDYVVIDIPPELVQRVRAIPGVIDVVPDKEYRVAYIPVAIDKKLAEFQRLFFSNPITGPPSAFAYAFKVDTGKKRVPTSESRKMVGADVAEQEGITGRGIKVAVLDTGTSYDFLFQGPYHKGKSSIEGQPVQLDEVGHGTHCQTTISGRPFQSIRGLLKGVAVDAEGAAFKCLGGGIGVGMTSWILRAMADAVEWNADIISMSLGGKDEDYTTSPYHRLISGLTKQGMIFVIAAGNSGPESNTIGSPGSCPDALTVGAVSYPDGKIAEFSSRGPCFPAETWIAVPNGKTKFRRIRDFKTGQKVWSYNEKQRMFEIDEVIEAYKFPLKKDIYEIHAEGGFKVRTTEDHPFYTENNNIVRLKQAKDLEEGDLVIINPDLARNSFGYKLNEDTCRKMSKAKDTDKFRQWLKCPERRKKISESSRRNKVTGRPEVKAKIGRATKVNWANAEYRKMMVEAGNVCVNPSVRKYHSRNHSTETIEQIRNSDYHKNLQGEKNPFYGKQHSIKTRGKLREKALQQEVTPISSQEVKLFGVLRQIYGDKAKQQWGIFLGPSLACKIDIAIPDNKVAIFVDGIYWHSLPGRKEKDKKVTKGLEQKGWLVKRFSDGEVDENLESCMKSICQHNATSKITLVKKINKKYSYVYHLSVKKNRNFIANGFAVHNTLNGLIKPDVCAPGVDILSTSSGYIAAMQFMDGPPSLAAISGTSMSTPSVSGWCALVKELYRKNGIELTTPMIKDMMEKYGREKDNIYGWGIPTWDIAKRYLQEVLL